MSLRFDVTEPAGSSSGDDLAYCAKAMATYNAQLQVREQSRKDKVAYASAVIDRQIEARERRMDRIFGLTGIVYQVERGVLAQTVRTRDSAEWPALAAAPAPPSPGTKTSPS